MVAQFFMLALFIFVSGLPQLLNVNELFPLLFGKVDRILIVLGICSVLLVVSTILTQILSKMRHKFQAGNRSDDANTVSSQGLAAKIKSSLSTIHIRTFIQPKKQRTELERWPQFEQFLFCENQRLRADLLTAIDTHGDSQFLEHLSLMLQANDIPKAVAFLDLLGKDRALKIFYKLRNRDRSRILAHMKASNYRGSPTDLIYSAGSEFRDKMVQTQSWGQGQSIGNPWLRERIMKLSIDESIDILSELSGDAVIRYLIYLSPNHLAPLLAVAREREHPLHDKLKLAFVRFQDAALMENFDQELLDMLSVKCVPKSDVKFSPFCDYYQSVLDHSEPAIANELLQSIRKFNPRMGSTLKSHLGSYDEFTRLEYAGQEQVCRDLSDREIASLIVGSQKGISGILNRTVDQVRYRMIEGEIRELSLLRHDELQMVHRMAREKFMRLSRKIASTGALARSRSRSQATARLLA